MKQSITKEVPFGIDNELNPFGDYALLRFTLTREKFGAPETATWSLIAAPNISNLPPKELNPDDVNEACVSLFFQQAKENLALRVDEK